ncbi:hypothetical protein KKG45_13225 [bacterium]|nr:hypothetical protein [bacterium]MBU1074202.1 hypothetical protein [bacterium]
MPVLRAPCRHRFVPFLTVGLLATFLGTFAALAAPPQPADDPGDEPFPHRRAEAERKAALHAGLAKAVQQRTANQDLYDVIHYDLDLDLDPGPDILTGVVTTTALVTGTSLAEIDLDLAAHMSITSVIAGGAPANWVRAGDLVTVSLSRAFVTGETVSVTVFYSGDPSGDYFGWDSADGQDMIWTLSEPFGAREWWPCKDLNIDKADSVDIRVTVPDNLIVASNGRLVSNVDNGATRTFHWHSDYPIVTYLVSLAIHPYTTFSHWYTPLGGGDPMEVQYYVYASHYSSVQATYGLTVPMIETFAQGFGEYPFVDEKYGHAEFVWGGGMEHQTLTSLGGWSEDLISHELSHQWWGDMITCADFHHIWLNEGFATWCEAYWKEQTAGVGTYRAYMDAAAYYGPGTVIVEDLSDFWGIFDSNLSYNKGSWIVHMLRGVMGDTDFFAGLADYRAQLGYGTATTEQFRDIMEAASGLELDAFFQQWIYGEYLPTYLYGWTTAPGEVSVTIEQIQTGAGLFTMPIVLRVTTDQGVYDFTVQNSLALETYGLTVPGAPQSVLLDPDGWILKRTETAYPEPSFDAGLLVVNGVDWSTYGAEITGAYADSIFWGDHDITFWDTFNEPAGGYPAALPAPAGHGPVPGALLASHSAVVWVGNNYNGDLNDWQDTPIIEYLESGGNLLLLGRMMSDFTAGDLDAYTGISWAETGASLGNCVSVHPDLIDIPLTGTQNWIDVFWPTGLPARTTPLFLDTVGFGGDRGAGAYTVPVAGGTHREDGGRLVLICGRPYRMNHAALRADVQTILDGFFGEPYSPPTAVGDGGTPDRPRLLSIRPNPFNPRTVIPFSLPRGEEIELSVYDAAGRLVRTLLRGELPAGDHEAAWHGQDERGRAVASGAYFARLRTSRGVEVKAMSLVR